MALSTTIAAAPPHRPVTKGGAPRPLASVRFDWAIVAASGWFLAGLYLDGWAHNTIPSLETFFTPWHGVLYSGFLVSLGVLGWAIGRNHAAGHTWWNAIPAGYELSLIGGLLFAASGVADMFWHIAFGIEANVDALLSPTHLLLLLGGTLFITGPLRAEARRRATGIISEGRSAQFPRVLAITYALAGLAFFTQYANVWGGPWLASGYRPLTGEVLTAGGRGIDAVFLLTALNVAGVLVQSALLAGFSLVALRGGRLPAGSFTLMIGLYTIGTILMRQKFDAGYQLPLAIAGVVAGVLLDVLYTRLRPDQAAPRARQTFVALVPAVTTAASILALGTVGGLWWSIHLWAGAVVLAAATGWLLSLLATPPNSTSTQPSS